MVEQDEIVKRAAIPRRQSSYGQDADVALCAEIVFKICFGVAKRHVMLFEQLVYLETTLELEQPAHLSLRQCTGPIRLNGDRLESSSGDIIPSTLERGRNVVRQVYGDLHGGSIVPPVHREHYRMTCEQVGWRRCPDTTQV